MHSLRHRLLYQTINICVDEPHETKPTKLSHPVSPHRSFLTTLAKEHLLESRRLVSPGFDFESMASFSHGKGQPTIVL
ncbi:hypothetical protein CA85_51500 [Allorhodopirellula solitaria]|uniref:Uncharacterized protein n=1 Tax=Allorhodopirellula solitaria TaxID=2527987 RepID=A0A5C5WMR0_9BACT|nr:hypothetical protein CA85_51500 [Allorhodopirellula solitaria]